MLYIVSRDGKSVNDFIEFHNIDKSNIKIVKTVSDLKGGEGCNYVIVPPLPFSYHWSIRCQLDELNMNNVTKYYNKHFNNF